MKQILIFAAFVVVVALLFSPSTMTDQALLEQLQDTYNESVVEFLEGGQDETGGYKLYRITDPDGTVTSMRVDVTYKKHGTKLGPDFKVEKYRVLK